MTQSSLDLKTFENNNHMVCQELLETHGVDMTKDDVILFKPSDNQSVGEFKQTTQKSHRILRFKSLA